MEPAIAVEGLGKKFRHRDANRPRTVRRLLEGGWSKFAVRRDFWALRDINFTVEPGEMLGVVGSNGSGKSTLLRMLGGVMRPDEGTVRSSDKVNGLLDLGAGMHPELTGRENAICSGVLAGLTRREITRKMDEVVAFAELERFIDEPLRSYSAGMKLRLGFAVAAQTRPRILLIDEVLAVGDVAFQRKCLDRIGEFRADGCAIVLISHDLVQVEAHCDRALWLRNGTQMALGATHTVARQYEAEMLASPGPVGTESADEGDEPRLGQVQNRIRRVRLLGSDGAEVKQIDAGDPLTVQIAIETLMPLRDLHFSVTLINEMGADLIDMTTEFEPQLLPDEAGEAVLELAWDRLDLSAGRYGFSIGIYEKSWAFPYDRRINSFHITVKGRESWCSVSPPHRWSVAQQPSMAPARA